MLYHHSCYYACGLCYCRTDKRTNTEKANNFCEAPYIKSLEQKLVYYLDGKRHITSELTILQVHYLEDDGAHCVFPLLVQTCFFRQFGQSVVRADYLTLRGGFIMVCYV